MRKKFLVALVCTFVWGNGASVIADSNHTDGVAPVVLPRYRIEHIRIQGIKRTRKSAILARLPVQIGTELVADDPVLDEIRWRLLGSGWFQQVQVSLARGSRHGLVDIVLQLQERNTLVVEAIHAGVAKGNSRTTDTSRNVEPYGGLAITERNLFGTGQHLTLHGVASRAQQGIRSNYIVPNLGHSPYQLHAAFQFNNGREFFGNDPQVSIRCPLEDSSCPEEILAKNAVVFYHRWHWGLGLGRQLGTNTHYTIGWQSDVINVGVLPEAASEQRGQSIRPLDFSIDPGRSFVSTLALGLRYDRRDRPVLTRAGTLLHLQSHLAGQITGSDYEFMRAQARLRHWWPLPSTGQSLRLGLYLGALAGRAPFFYRFFAADLSDLIPARVLGMTLDSRLPPNLFRNRIGESRSGDVASRADVEYAAIFYMGKRGFPVLQGYVNTGLYILGNPRQHENLTAGFSGASRVPVDLTFDVGLRIESQFGLFQIGFSTLIGFIAP